MLKSAYLLPHFFKNYIRRLFNRSKPHLKTFIPIKILLNLFEFNYRILCAIPFFKIMIMMAFFSSVTYYFKIVSISNIERSTIKIF